MPASPHISEEAVEAVAFELSDDLPAEMVGGAWLDDPLADEWGEWAHRLVEVALPTIRKQAQEQERERIREALRSPDLVRGATALAQDQLLPSVRPGLIQDVATAIIDLVEQSALDAQEDSDA